MKTVGKQLQEARLAKNWTPELAARETKIKIERLHDLEADDYSHFSSPTYARGFVRTYARALGLDEYKVLRQLDNKLPDDDTANIVTDGGVAYLPETSLPPRAAHRDYTGLYIVMGLGAVVALISVVVLFEAYRVGELPSYFAGSNSTSSPATTNSTDTPAAPSGEPVARALPVDSNTPPPIPDTVTNTPVATAPPAEPVAPRALPVDPSELTAANNTPAPTPTPDAAVPNAPRALPVDPAELNNTPPPAPADNSAPAAPRALPVSAADLAAAAANPPAQQGTTTPVNAPAAPVASPVAQPVAPPPDAAPPTPSTTTAPASPDQPANSAPTPSASTTPGTDQRLVLTASQDSFVSVTTLDAPDKKPLYAAVLHSGQSVGFAGHRFTVHVGVPSAVDIKLDGVNYGPHSDHAAPETFNVESHLP